MHDSAKIMLPLRKSEYMLYLSELKVLGARLRVFRDTKTFLLVFFELLFPLSLFSCGPSTPCITQAQCEELSRISIVAEKGFPSDSLLYTIDKSTFGVLDSINAKRRSCTLKVPPINKGTHQLQIQIPGSNSMLDTVLTLDYYQNIVLSYDSVKKRITCTVVPGTYSCPELKIAIVIQSSGFASDSLFMTIDKGVNPYNESIRLISGIKSPINTCVEIYPLLSGSFHLFRFSSPDSTAQLDTNVFVSQSQTLILSHANTGKHISAEVKNGLNFCQ